MEGWRCLCDLDGKGHPGGGGGGGPKMSPGSSYQLRGGKPGRPIHLRKIYAEGNQASRAIVQPEPRKERD